MSNSKACGMIPMNRRIGRMAKNWSILYGLGATWALFELKRKKGEKRIQVQSRFDQTTLSVVLL